LEEARLNSWTNLQVTMEAASPHFSVLKHILFDLFKVDPAP